MNEPDLISFARGAPSLDIIDVEGLAQAAARAFDVDPQAVTGYGPAGGYRPLREWIAERTGGWADPNRVMLTNGSLQAAVLVFDHLLRRGDVVVVERPTYDRTLTILKRLGVVIRPVDTDELGLDVDQLRQLLDAGLRPKLVHVIPNFQNPSGVTLATARRHALVELAHRYQFTVLEDDPYRQIRFRGEELPTLLELEAGMGGRSTSGGTNPAVVYLSSFTKTVCPGVRVGYLITGEPLVSQLAARAINTYISPNMVGEVTVDQFARAGSLDRSVVTVCGALSERAALLGKSLLHEIEGCHFREPGGGYFLWVGLPDHIDTRRLEAAAVVRGVSVVSGHHFVVDGHPPMLRLAFSAVRAEQVPEGVRRLAAAISDVSNSP